MLLLFLLPAVALALQDQYIVNGNDYDISEVPWQGSYRTASGSHTCGCVYIGSNWVLTAGHCGGSSAYTAGFGSSSRTGVTPSSITQVTRHPSYGIGSGFTPNDFAVVELNAAPASASSVSIPSDGNNPGGNGVISGWGRTCGSCGLPDQLQGVELPMISDSECNTRWGSSFNSDLMICVYNGSQGACNGDSGGPLVANNMLYGVTSWGAAGCSTSTPSVYAKVGAVNDWICSTAGGAPDGC